MRPRLTTSFPIRICMGLEEMLGMAAHAPGAVPFYLKCAQVAIVVLDQTEIEPLCHVNATSTLGAKCGF